MNAKISKAILIQIESGKTVQEAIDAILGQGTSEKIISDLYDALRNKTK